MKPIEGGKITTAPGHLTVHMCGLAVKHVCSYNAQTIRRCSIGTGWTRIYRRKAVIEYARIKFHKMSLLFFVKYNNIRELYVYCYGVCDKIISTAKRC